MTRTLDLNRMYAELERRPGDRVMLLAAGGLARGVRPVRPSRVPPLAGG
ncbi:MAG: hypothetical protein U0797_26320 [Gemmataceae bacterium]